MRAMWCERGPAGCIDSASLRGANGSVRSARPDDGLRDEATKASPPLDCFASLAMTTYLLSASRPITSPAGAQHHARGSQCHRRRHQAVLGTAEEASLTSIAHPPGLPS